MTFSKKITAISDLHGHLPHKLQGGDILIVAGDLTARDTPKQLDDFWRWCLYQNFNHIVVIAGNHDTYLENNPEFFRDRGPDFYYLCDEYIEIEGVKIYGSPRSVYFEEVNPLCSAFMLPDTDLIPYWEKIPDNLDILITHTPPWGILDQVITSREVRNCGSKYLTEVVLKKKPRYHIFGHLHEHGGMVYNNKDTTFMNVSHVDQDYEPHDHEGKRDFTVERD